MGGNGIMKHRLLILGTLGEFEQLVQKAREQDKQRGRDGPGLGR